MGNRASQKESKNNDNDNDQNINGSMAVIYVNDKSSSRYFGDSSQLTNCILDSRATCHMIPQVSDFIPGPLEDTDKYIEVADGHHVTEKQKEQVQIKMCDNNRDTFIATFPNVLLAPDICDGLFSLITLINLVYNCLFQKVFCTVYFGDKEKNTVNLPHSAQRKHAFLVKTKENNKSKKIVVRVDLTKNLHAYFKIIRGGYC